MVNLYAYVFLHDTCILNDFVVALLPLCCCLYFSSHLGLQIYSKGAKASLLNRIETEMEMGSDGY